MLSAHLAWNAELAILVQPPGPDLPLLSQREAAVAAGGHLHHLQSSGAPAQRIKAGQLVQRPSTQARRQVGHGLGCMPRPFPREQVKESRPAAAWPRGPCEH